MLGFLFGSKDKALIAAVKKGAIDDVRALLAKGHPPSARHGGLTALGTAIGEGHGEIARVLLEAGADPNRPGDAEADALSITLMTHDEATTALLLEKGARLDVRAEEGFTALHLAAGRATTKQLTLVLACSSIDAATTDGRTPLYEACYWGAFENAGLLLDRGASVKSKAHDGTTPLAALVGSMRMWSVMASASIGGTAVEAKGIEGIAALVQATRDAEDAVLTAPPEMLTLIDRLISAGSDLAARDHEGATLLEVALRGGAPEPVIAKLKNRRAK